MKAMAYRRLGVPRSKGEALPEDTLPAAWRITQGRVGSLYSAKQRNATGNVPPAEFEAAYYRQQGESAMVA